MMASILAGLILLCIAWILVLLGLGFVIISLYFYLTTHLGPAASALICGLVVIIIAASLVFLLRIFSKIKASQTKTKIKSTVPDVLSLIDKYFGASVLTVATLGFLVGFSKEVRKTLVDGVCVIVKKYVGHVTKNSCDDKKE